MEQSINKLLGHRAVQRNFSRTKEVEGGGAYMPSTIIQKSRYDPEARVLSVWLLTNGKRYEYRDVPPETYGAFRAAFSKGRFFNRHIRTNFVFDQIDEDCPTGILPPA